MNRNWIAAVAVAATLAATATGVRAQDAGTGTTTDTASPTSTGASGSMSGSLAGSTTSTTSGGMGTPDYSLLNNKTFDYTDIASARARGLSDPEIAVAVKIAEKTGQSFREVADAVLRGQTFAELAYENNLRLEDVLDASDEQAKVANYEAAYMTTGRHGAGMSSAAGMSGGMSADMSAPMGSAAPMAGGVMSNKDIVDTAMGDRRFRTLVRELKKAGLVDTLKAAGPFTVFAPTDDAFKKLPDGALKNLEDNPDQLRAVLTYHVIPSRIDAAAAMAMTSPTSPPTVQGGTLQITTSNGIVMVNDARVVQADIMATNGIIHAIDTVLMPPAVGATSGTSTGQ